MDIFFWEKITLDYFLATGIRRCKSVISSPFSQYENFWSLNKRKSVRLLKLCLDLQLLLFMATKFFGSASLKAMLALVSPHLKTPSNFYLHLFYLSLSFVTSVGFRTIYFLHHSQFQTNICNSIGFLCNDWFETV